MRENVQVLLLLYIANGDGVRLAALNALEAHQHQSIAQDAMQGRAQERGHDWVDEAVHPLGDRRLDNIVRRLRPARAVGYRLLSHANTSVS